MKNQWVEQSAKAFVEKYKNSCSKEVALRLYSSSLLALEKGLVLHGGGNISLKSSVLDIFGNSTDALFVKASGYDLKGLGPAGLPSLDLTSLRHLNSLDALSDEGMLNELRRNLFDTSSGNPSIETLLHAFIPKKYIDHTHSDAILTLTCQLDGKKWIESAFGNSVIWLDYYRAGFTLAKEAAKAFENNPQAKGMILAKHGLIAWGETAKESYDNMIEIVTQAEGIIQTKAKSRCIPSNLSDNQAKSRFVWAAPIIRGIFNGLSEEELPLNQTHIIRPLIDKPIRDLLETDGAKNLCLSAVLTPDHLIRTKALPLWLDEPDFENRETFQKQMENAVQSYIKEYRNYLKRNHKRRSTGAEFFDPLPRMILIPGLGALCIGETDAAATIVQDILRQTLLAKEKVLAMSGEFAGLEENHLFDMEYMALQHHKLVRAGAQLRRRVAIVTGAAGAIGSGICCELLEQGCHVLVTDLSPKALEPQVELLKELHGTRVEGAIMDVTDETSIQNSLDLAVSIWGGVDLLVINAGLAHVSTLEDMDYSQFKKLERVNLDGTLFLLKHTGRFFRHQNCGGDIVLVSTKNVFAPGAGFGAYSATKAASHQLARIACLEMASMRVRVNMVSPDGVFSDGEIKSGLWATVGPDRMKARGLDEKGLEDYYNNRNLLKTKITARDVGRAVAYFATRQTPTTGATIPVDGGLPDATPR